MPRSSVQIGCKRMFDGSLRLFVPISFANGSKVEAFLDTGSSGLRVLRWCIADGVDSAGGKRAIYTFGTGVELIGTLENCSISIGKDGPSISAMVHFVDDVACVRARPRCPANQMPKADFRIGGAGRPLEGFAAVLGASPFSRALSDLPTLGYQSWIITAPSSEGEVGELVLNPTQQECLGFETLSLCSAVFGDAGIQAVGIDAALVNETDGSWLLAPALMDTGAASVDVFHISKKWGQVSPVSKRMSFRLRKRVAGSFKCEFAASTSREATIRHWPRGAWTGSWISLGILPFLNFHVLFDALNGTIGLKSRSSAGQLLD